MCLYDNKHTGKGRERKGRGSRAGEDREGQGKAGEDKAGQGKAREGPGGQERAGEGRENRVGDGKLLMSVPCLSWVWAKKLCSYLMRSAPGY